MRVGPRSRPGLSPFDRAGGGMTPRPRMGSVEAASPVVDRPTRRGPPAVVVTLEGRLATRNQAIGHRANPRQIGRPGLAVGTSRGPAAVAFLQRSSRFLSRPTGP